MSQLDEDKSIESPEGEQQKLTFAISIDQLINQQKCIINKTQRESIFETDNPSESHIKADDYEHYSTVGRIWRGSNILEVLIKVKQIEEKIKKIKEG